MKKENIVPLYTSRFINLYDLQYEEGKHYYDASRRKAEDIVAIKSDEEFKSMLPDAVSCALILKVKGQEPKLYLSREYRYPAGQFLLSVPAGLIDAEDAAPENTGSTDTDTAIAYAENPIFLAAIREIEEETGITVEGCDTIRLINPLLFSTPGMTDESNALVQITLNRDSMPLMSQEGGVGGECFDGYMLVTREEAKKILRDGTDAEGRFYSVYTWMVLMCFVTDLF